MSRNNTKTAQEVTRVIDALRTVPEKRLLLIELVNIIPIKYGMLDPQVLSDMQPQINLASAEAKAYAQHTVTAVDALVRLAGVDEDADDDREDLLDALDEIDDEMED